MMRVLHSAALETAMPNEIHAFQTGRWYSEHGQRIAWCVLSTGNVAMVDVDRGIDYVLLHRPDITPSHGTVLALYDRNFTSPYFALESKEARELEPALRAAALAVPSMVEA